MTFHTASPTEVLIAGGGVAGLETALALTELAGDRVRITMIAPNPEFVYRPMRVREPFALEAARHYSLQEIARDVGFAVLPDALALVDPQARVVQLRDGAKLRYDALVLALGATPRPAFRHAITLDDARLDDQLHGLIQDVEQGYVHSVAFVSPSLVPWPLPLYELALMTAQRADEMGVECAVSLATPEDAPLAIFGAEVSAAVGKLLAESGVQTFTSAHCTIPSPNEVLIHPGSRRIAAERIVALPELFGPATSGVPKDVARGFIPVDEYCRVRKLDRVYAAGDATDFPVKQGGVGSQQADTVAQSIAALAGAPVTPERFHPHINGMLVSLGRPKFLSAQLSGGHGTTSRVSETPTWSPPVKIAARYLAPYLEQRDRTAEAIS
jgi:sulfide:quinone oxidoreductase